MKPVSDERAVWLGQCIFPYEGALRVWLARRPLAPFIEIDDVVQETYAVLAGLDCVSHIRNPRTYMFEVAKSIVRAAFRRSQVVTIDAVAELDALQIPATDPSPETVAADRQELRRIAELIAQLPPRCRDAFVLRKIHGLPQREIANSLGISESTVEKHIIKALSLLSRTVSRGVRREFASFKQSDHDQFVRLPKKQRKR